MSYEPDEIPPVFQTDFNESVQHDKIINVHTRWYSGSSNACFVINRNGSLSTKGHPTGVVGTSSDKWATCVICEYGNDKNKLYSIILHFTTWGKLSKIEWKAALAEFNRFNNIILDAINTADEKVAAAGHKAYTALREQLGPQLDKYFNPDGSLKDGITHAEVEAFMMPLLDARVENFVEKILGKRQ